MANPRRNRIVPYLVAVGALVLFAFLAYTAHAVPAAQRPKAWNLAERFSTLSSAHTNLCSSQGFIASMNNNSYIQGSCCSPMQFDSYEEQVSALRNYSNISMVPSDPYNVSVSDAKAMLSYSNMSMTPGEQMVLDNAMNVTKPCCCHCWRWDANVGLAKYMIRYHGVKSDEVARLWHLVDGCGGPLDSPSTPTGMMQG